MASEKPVQLRLAPHFPFVPKPCAAVAEPFFACFSEKSAQPPGGVRINVWTTLLPAPLRVARTGHAS